MELKVTFLVTCALYHLANAMPADDFLTQDMVSECQASSGVTEAEAEELKTTKIVQDESDDRKKCFVVCLLTKSGVIQGGKLNEEIMVIVLKALKPHAGKDKEAEYREGIAECNEKTGEGKCGSSYNAWKCFFQMSIQLALSDMAEKS